MPGCAIPMGDDCEWFKLASEDKVQHKLWKARVAGYNELIKLFQTIDDEKSPEFTKYLGSVCKMVVDSNVIAQEKALEVVLIFVENAACAGKAAGEICGGIVTNCLNSSRTKTREKALEIVLMLIEIEKQDIVQEELIKGLIHKQPKIVSACVMCLREGLRCFGSKTMPIKPLLKSLHGLLEHRDLDVREECKQLVIEMYRWVGVAIKALITSLKPVQVQELETEFEKEKPGKAVQCRYLRSQQELKEKAEAAAVAGDTNEEEEENDGIAEDIDPYEFMEAVDIISELPKDYYEKIESKKLKERKEALKALQRLAEYPKLEQKEHGDVVQTLKKVISNEPNVFLVVIAVKITTSLCNGLRKQFASSAPGLIQVCLEKFKEKNLYVVEPLKKCVDCLFQQTNLDTISQHCVKMLYTGTPNVKSETASFLARCFCRCSASTLPKELLKLFITPLLKMANDSNPEVRNASFNLLGTAMKVLSEEEIMPFLTDVDALKMTKIKESCKNAQLIGKSGKVVPQKKEPVKEPPKVAKEIAAKPDTASSSKAPAPSTDELIDERIV